MATITFRAKAEQVYEMSGAPAFVQIRVPTLTRKHCDMDAFRRHAKYGGLANSDLFPNVLSRIRRDVAKYDYIRLDRLPDNVAVDTSGFLALVTINA